MAGQLIFFNKNKADYTEPNLVVTASQGQTYALRAFNRSPLTAWATSGSVDADNTTLVADWGDPKGVSDILLLDHNFKSFKVEYWDGSAWQTFSTPIDTTTNTAASNYYEFTRVLAYKVRLTVRGTQTANQDKYLFQFIATEKIGRLSGWPKIENPQIDLNQRVSKMLSGKVSISNNVGGFKASLTVENWSDTTDLGVIQELFRKTRGFLFWPCGGDTSQFKVQGVEIYRMEDIYYCKCTNSFSPQLYDGMYYTGMKIRVDLAEAIE